MAETRCYRMSGENLDEFIDLYHSAECLWNVKCTKYRDINARNKAYEGIAEILNTTTDLVKKKINNLRSTYIQEKKKVDLSKSTGSATDDVYTPSLWWFEKLRFLDDVICPRKTVSSLEKMSEKRQMTEEFETHKTEEGSRITKKKKVSTEQTHFDEALKTFTKICSAESTEFDKFGESVAAQLKSLPIREALKLQLEIQQVITSRKLRLLDSELPSTYTSTVISEVNFQERPLSVLSSSTSPTPQFIFSPGSSTDSTKLNETEDVLYAALKTANIPTD